MSSRREATRGLQQPFSPALKLHIILWAKCLTGFAKSNLVKEENVGLVLDEMLFHPMVSIPRIKNLTVEL